MVMGHPLALRLAWLVISDCGGVAEYCRNWRDGTQDVHINAESYELTRTIEMSFKNLELKDPNAAQALKLFGFLDHKDFWYDLFLGSKDFSCPKWLRQLADNKLRGSVITSLNRSFITCGTLAAGTLEIHPAIHNFARQLAQSHGEGAELSQLAAKLVAARVPRTYDQQCWYFAKRLEPHADQCIKHPDPDSIYDAATLDKIGSLYRILGRLEEAEELYSSILKLESNDHTLGVDADFLAGVYNHLGLVYLRQGKDNDAVKMFKMSIEEAKWSNPETLSNLAKALIRSRRVDEAKSYWQMLKSDLETVADEEDIHRSRMTIELAIMTASKPDGDLLSVEQELRSAIRFQEQYFLSEPDHLILLSAKHKLATICLQLSQHTEASNILEDLVSQYRKTLGQDHNDTKAAMQSLAEAYMEKGLTRRENTTTEEDGTIYFEQAYALYEEVLRLYGSQINQIKCPAALSARLNFGILNSYMEHLDFAKTQIDYVVRERKQSLGAQHLSTLEAGVELAVVLQRQKYFHIAEGNFQRIIESCEANPNPDYDGRMLLYRTLYLQGKMYQDWSLDSRGDELMKLKAQQAFERVLNQSPEDNEFHQEAEGELEKSERAQVTSHKQRKKIPVWTKKTVWPASMFTVLAVAVIIQWCT